MGLTGAMRTTGTAGMTYAERLLPGALGWVTAVGFGLFLGVALYPAGQTVALVVGAVATVGGVVGAVAASPRVAVTAGELRAGPARIPVALLGAPEVLDRAGVHASLGPGSDARTWALLRAWLPGAVLVPVTDPQDPTPAWLVSSRRADDLAVAIVAAQAAHSEQIG